MRRAPGRIRRTGGAPPEGEGRNRGHEIQHSYLEICRRAPHGADWPTLLAMERFPSVDPQLTRDMGAGGI